MEPLNAPFVSSLTPEQVRHIKVVQLIIRDYVQVASWGIIKMNDYLVSGTRQQYWEEFFVKHVMSVSLVLLPPIKWALTRARPYNRYFRGKSRQYCRDYFVMKAKTGSSLLISQGREILNPLETLICISIFLSQSKETLTIMFMRLVRNHQAF